MKLQTFEYFVQIANEGSYTKAAEKCFVSQPALSKAISEFEKELNCILFQRNGRRIELTEMGKLVYDEVKIILEHCESIEEKVSGKKMTDEPIKLGYIILNHLKYFYETVKVADQMSFSTIYDSTATIRKKLLNDELDIILVPNSTENGMKNVNVHYFSKRHLYVMAHPKCPVYKYDVLTFKDLENIPIVSWDNEDLPQVARAYDEEFIEHGVVPNVVARAKKMGDMVSLILQHKAAGLSGPITTEFSEEDFKLIPIIDSTEKYGLCAIWKKNNKNSSLMKLVSHL